MRNATLAIAVMLAVASACSRSGVRAGPAPDAGVVSSSSSSLARASSASATPSTRLLPPNAGAEGSAPPARVLDTDFRGAMFARATYSADGLSLATAGADASVWDRRSSARVAVVPSGTNGIQSLAFSADSKRLAIAGGSELRVFDVTAGIADDKRLIASITPAEGELVVGFAWSADGRAIDFASSSGTVATMSTADGRVTKTLRPASDAKLSFAAWSADRRIVALAHRTSDRLVLVDAATGAELRPIADTPREVILALSFDAPGKRLLAVYNGENAVRIFGVDSGRQIAKLGTKETRIEHAAWSPDAKSIAVAGFGGAARVIDAQSGRETHALGPHSRSIDGVAWSPDGKELTAAGVHATSWDLDKKTIVARWIDFFGGNDAMGCSANGRIVATHDPDFGIALFDVDLGTMRAPTDVATLETRDAPRTLALAITADASRASVITDDGAVTHWDVATLARARTKVRLEGFSGQRPEPSPDGRYVATFPAPKREGLAGIGPGSIAGQKALCVWSLDTGKIVARGEASIAIDATSNVTWSPSGDVLAVTSDGRVTLVDAKTGKRLRDFAIAKLYAGPLGPRPVPAIFTPDGEKLLATGAAGKGADTWRVASGEHESYVALLSVDADARVAPGGKWLAGDGRLADIASGNVVASIERGSAGPPCFAKDGAWTAFPGARGPTFVRADGRWLSVERVPLGGGWTSLAIASDATFDAEARLLPALMLRHEGRAKAASELHERRRERLAARWLGER